MTDLASLVVRLEAQTAQYDAKLEAANRKLGQFAKQTDKSLNQLKKSFGALNKGLGFVGLGVSVAAVGSAFTHSIGAAIEFGDEIQKATAKTGIGAQELSELAYVAKQSDVEFGALTIGLKKMQQAVSQAASGSKEQSAMFRALQIDIKALRELKPDQQFELIAEKISRIKDPADRTRAAVALFGKSGADLLPMFEQGAEGIRMAREEAEKMNATLSAAEAKELAAADDAIKKLDSAWGGLTRTMAIGFAPALADTLAGFTELIKLLGGAEARVLSFGQVWDGVQRAMAKNRGGFTSIWEIQAELRPDAVKNGPLNNLRAELEQLRQERDEVARGVASLGERSSTFLRDSKLENLDRQIKEMEAEVSRVEKEVETAERKTRTRPGGFRRNAEIDLADTLAEDDEKKRSAAAAAAKIERERLAALEKQADAYKAVLDAGMETIEGLQTPTERITAQYEQQRFALEEMARTYPAMADQAEVAMGRLEEATKEALLEGIRSPTEQIIADFERQKKSIEETAAKYPELAAQASAALARISKETAEAIQEADPAYQEHLKLVEEGKTVYDSTRTEVEQWANEIERLTMLFEKGVISQDTFTRAIEKANEELKRGDALTVFWEEAARNFQDLLADFLFEPFEDGLDGMLEDFGRMLQKMAAQAIAADIMGKIFGAPTATGGFSGGGLLDAAIGFIGGLFGGSKLGGLEDIAVTAQRIPTPFSGPRASGGDVKAGHRYTVGEQGTEWFVPEVNGRIERIEKVAKEIPYGGPRASGGIVRAGYRYTVGEQGAERYVAGMDGRFDRAANSPIFDVDVSMPAANAAAFDAAATVAPYAGPRASGGDVMAGYSYSVGEQGAERFVPLVDGEIQKVDGGDNVTNNFNFTVHTPDGKLSRATQQQLAAAAARGAATANRRNN